MLLRVVPHWRTPKIEMETVLAAAVAAAAVSALHLSSLSLLTSSSSSCANGRDAAHTLRAR